MKRCEFEPEVAERYVAGVMAEPEQATFEDHFFACEECFQTVQALEQARSLLTAGHATAGDAEVKPSGPATSSWRPSHWMAAAATLILAVAIWQLSRPTDPQPDVPAATEAVSQPQQVSPTPPALVAPAMTPAPAPVRSAAVDPKERMAKWAAVTPPQYLALTTRSERDADAEAFDVAMAHYSAGRHRVAADGLKALAQRAPDAAHVHFFLGISQLMTGNHAEARGALQRCADAGVTPYSDEAHFYLAKAALRAGDLDAAAQELKTAVDRDAGPRGQAARILAEITRNAER